MRKVVVTGLGIVSCIGNNKKEVLTSLLEVKSGISHCKEYEELGMRSHVHGKPNLNTEEHVDRKILRFMGEGAAYNHIAMQEAMACGAVPVMSDLPCVREWIDHDQNGILTPAKDIKRLANEIIELLENNEKRSSFVERNLKLIEEKGDQEMWMKQVEDLYYSLLNKKGK